MHILQAFIVKEEHLAPYVRRVSLPQGFALIPGDEFLIAQFPELEGKGTIGFSKLFCGGHPVLSVFTDYFGGPGEQKTEDSTGAWNHDHDSIDVGLKKLGVVKTNGDDEFDTINLGNYRDTSTALGSPRSMLSITKEEVYELCGVLGWPVNTKPGERTHLWAAMEDGGWPMVVEIYEGPVLHFWQDGTVTDPNNKTNENFEDLIMKLTSKMIDEERDIQVADIMAKRKIRDDNNRKVQEFLSRKNFYINPK